MKKQIKDLHLLVTTLCNRNCKYCCNKQYDLNTIPYVSDKDFKESKAVYLTGGEPIQYCDVDEIAYNIKARYPHIKKVYVYCNASELFIKIFGRVKFFQYIDGFDISIKDQDDKTFFELLIKKYRQFMRFENSRLYIFGSKLYPNVDNYIMRHFESVILRKWQKKFKPAKNCLFRKL